MYFSFMNIAIIVLLIILVGLIIYLLLRPQKQESSDQSMTMLQNQIEGLRKQTSDTLSQQLSQIRTEVNQQLQNVTQQLSTQTGQIGDRLDKAASVISEVKKEVGGLSQASKQIYDVGKDISKLSEILKAPKARGILGEFSLESLLGQILPQEYFELQYSFKSGEKVDAVVKLGQKFVPIDAKYVLAKFNRITESTTEEERNQARKEFFRDVRGHIDKIAGKYILPDEGTYDFAMMYVPAENVYYEIIMDSGDKSVSRYALEQKIILVSPNSLYAYLQAIVLGLRGLKIEQRAEQILVTLQKLTNDFDNFKGEFETLGKHISNAHGKYEDAEKKLMKFDNKLSSVESMTPEEEIKKLR